MQSMVAFIALISFMACLTGRTSAQSDTTSTASPKAEVMVLTPQESHVGERLLLTLQIKNVGKTPFYITPAIESLDYLGGFEVSIISPPGSRLQGGGREGGDPLGKIDILKDVKNFILLKPGEAYGGNMLCAVVPVPGRYRIVGRRSPLRVNAAAKNKLETELKFPMLFNVVESKPLFIEVKK